MRIASLQISSISTGNSRHKLPNQTENSFRLNTSQVNIKYLCTILSLGGKQHCNSCNRFFKNQTTLDQHLQDSKMHKTAILPPPQVQTTMESRKYIIPGPHRRNPSLLDTIASSSCTSQAPSCHRDKNYKDKGSWSVIPESENMALLEKLSRNCHSPEELLKKQIPPVSV